MFVLTHNQEPVDDVFVLCTFWYMDSVCRLLAAKDGARKPLVCFESWLM